MFLLNLEGIFCSRSPRVAFRWVFPRNFARRPAGWRGGGGAAGAILWEKVAGARGGGAVCVCVRERERERER